MSYLTASQKIPALAAKPVAVKAHTVQIDKAAPAQIETNFAGAFGWIAFCVVLIGFFAGLSRMGFAAGLAWFAGVALLTVVAWPLGLVCALAIVCYGLKA
jgi:hypothetical protein